MEDIEIFQRMGRALAIGAVVGVERHWREKDKEEGSPKMPQHKLLLGS